jgi:UPF0716 protein FxsA
MNPIRFVLFALPLIEIALFIVVGSWIGVLPTLFLVVATTFVGLLLLRIQNVAVMRYMQQSLRNGKHARIFDMRGHSLVVFAGLLLILPGFFTDFIGLLCLIPVLRTFLSDLFVHMKIFRKRPPFVNHDTRIINGTCWHEGEEPPKKDAP